MLNKEELGFVREIVETRLDEDGYIVDNIDDCENHRFLHQLARNFYSSDDSSEKADAAFADVLSIMDSYNSKKAKNKHGENIIIYTRI